MKVLLFIYSLSFLFFGCNQKENNHSTNQTNTIDDLPPMPKKIDAENLIGFGCSVSGEQSKSVNEFGKLLLKKDYIGIRNFLTHKIAAKKYLATVICETLEKKKIIALTLVEKKQIIQNKTSTETVHLCSGCTYQDILTLKELFTDENILSEQTQEWISENLK